MIYNKINNKYKTYNNPKFNKVTITNINIFKKKHIHYHKFMNLYKTIVIYNKH